jgi:class 3 adenylate cyclase/tetratricopeptide (TPR) repeat protein
MALCPSCGKDNPPGFKFCGFCTAALDVTPPATAEERKVVSILFVDLVGFTSRSHDADPEDVKAALTPYHSLLKREIERFGGTVEKFIGDAVMAVFGAPVAHEDDAERAVRTALRITEAIAELNGDNAGLDLSIRAAVNTGEGLVALGARPEQGEGLVTGDVVNTASRLQNTAPVNGVVVGEMTYRSTREFIDYDELQPVSVKGKPEPVAVWQALSAKSRFGVDADIAPKTPFIGRDYELDALKGSFKRALRGSTIQLVTVVGEPGVGKSRLLSEFSSYIDEQQELVFWRQGRSLPYGEGITFWSLGEIVKAHAGILESDSSDQAGHKLREAVAAVVPEGSEQHWFLSRLGPLIGVEVSGGGSPQKEESFTAWRRFLEAIAERRPLVLVFEDLHWADPSLLEFIEHLVDWVSGVPLFVVCTARPELYDKHPNWGGGKRNITIVSLSPLDDSETTQLISSLLSQAVLPPEVHSALLERAGGNPLYAEEFVRMLSDHGILTQRGKVLTLVKDAEIPVPESVQALIAARLDTLTPERKSLLHDASVAGKVFWSGAVAAIGGADLELVRHGLHELGSKELVRPSRISSMEDQEEYSFWHALIRDVCYGQIPRAARAQRHKAMAAWIESTAERHDDYAELLAHHYSTALELAQAAGMADIPELKMQAHRFLVIAAERALKLNPVNALNLYRQALELLDLDDPATPKALHGAGTACMILGMLPEAETYLEQAIPGLSKQADRVAEASALESQGLLLRNLGRSEEGRRLVERAVDLLEQEPPTEALSRAYRSLGFFQLAVDSFRDALASADRAISIAKSCGSDNCLGRGLDLRGTVRSDTGDPGGLDDLREALRLAEEGGDADVQVLAYNNLADRIWLRDGPAEGLRLNKKAHSLSRSFGYVHAAFWAQLGGLFMLFELGDWGEVLAQSEEIAAWAEAHDATFVSSGAAFFTALVKYHRGDLGAARALEESFLSTFREVDDLEGLSPCLALAALIHAFSGDVARARSLIEEFHTKTERALHYRARYLPDVLRATVAIGDIGLGSKLLVEERDVAYHRDHHALVTGRAIQSEATGRLDLALDLYSDAAKRWSEHGFLLEQGQALLGAGRCLIALGHEIQASPRLQEAQRIFAKLGAAPRLQETDGFLQEAIRLSS